MEVDAKGALVISLDFELHWGVRDKWSVESYKDNLLGVREVVPAMLRLFRESGIHATWATVGLLFFDSKREMLESLPQRRPAYLQPELSPYPALASVGDNEKADPFHFAPSLIRRIAETPHQELGTHTFSHYYCLEAGQSPAEFREDLQAAVQVMRHKLGRPPRSIVFPRNQVSASYVEVCGELGLAAYRGNLDVWAYRARGQQDESLLRRGVRFADAYLPLTATNSTPLRIASDSEPVNVPASRYLRPYSAPLRHLEPLRLRRLTSDLQHAARNGRIFHLWWHPHDFGAHRPENLSVLRQILTCFVRLRETHGMESLTMAEAARLAVPRPVSSAADSAA